MSTPLSPGFAGPLSPGFAGPLSPGFAGPLSPGFADPVLDAQAAFRALLDAMARPGRVATLPAFPEPPAGLAPAAAAVALALCDADTPVWLDEAAAPAAAWLRFHGGCRIVPDAALAAFVFAMRHAPAMATLDAGQDPYPDRAATLVLAVAGFGTGSALRLSGPGIPGTASVRVEGLAEDFLAERAANHAKFPRGVDCILVAGQQAMCLPRTTRLEIA
jgi:alpha-D-ribose 1-methylphosphonate 5-triphosphate synthase subunit PhnH